VPGAAGSGEHRGVGGGVGREYAADRLDHLAESGLETSKGIDRIANALERIATALETLVPSQKGRTSGHTTH